MTAIAPCPRSLTVLIARLGTRAWLGLQWLDEISIGEHALPGLF